MKKKLIVLLTFGLCINMAAQETDIQKEERRRMFISDFIATYEAAYEKKDTSYISAFFSTNSLIITETKTLLRSGEELVPRSSKKRPYKLIVEDKKNYIKRLYHIFENNQKIQLYICNQRVMKHPKYPEIYGVAFTQMWKDQGGGDNIEDDMIGYVFLLIDFKDLENTPMIHIRTWQPNSNISSPKDKYTISDFHIYETF